MKSLFLYTRNDFNMFGKCVINLISLENDTKKIVYMENNFLRQIILINHFKTNWIGYYV